MKFLRVLAAASALGLGVSLRAAAQIEITPRVGIRFDRSDHFERALVFRLTHYFPGDAWQVPKPANPAAIGLRIGTAVHPRVRLSVDIERSTSSADTLRVNNTDLPRDTFALDPNFRMTRLMVRARAEIEATHPERASHLRAAFGILVVKRSGTGETFLTSDQSVGGSFGINYLWMFGRNLGLHTEALVDIYGSQYLRASGSPQSPYENFTHIDPAVHVGLTLRFGKVPQRGPPSLGPGAVPERRPNSRSMAFASHGFMALRLSDAEDPFDGAAHPRQRHRLVGCGHQHDQLEAGIPLIAEEAQPVRPVKSHRFVGVEPKCPGSWLQ